VNELALAIFGAIQRAVQAQAGTEPFAFSTLYNSLLASGLIDSVRAQLLSEFAHLESARIPANIGNMQVRAEQLLGLAPTSQPTGGGPVPSMLTLPRNLPTLNIPWPSAFQPTGGAFQPPTFQPPAPTPSPIPTPIAPSGGGFTIPSIPITLPGGFTINTPQIGGGGGGGIPQVGGQIPTFFQQQGGQQTTTVGPGGIIYQRTTTQPAPPQLPGPGMAGAGVACPTGFHPNKSAYWTSAGYVAKGTKCVRNRRRNPLNPRALDRAIGRITSAKRASKKLGRITVRKKCP
jgi:hypothetical protein